MENYERTKELIEVTENAEGKSSKQFAKYADTIEFKVNKLKNTWEQAKTSFFDSDFYSGLIEAGTKIVEKFKGLDWKKLLVIAPIALAAGRQMAQQWVKGFADGSKQIGSVIGNVIGKVTKRFGNIELNAQVKLQEAATKLDVLKNKKLEIELAVSKNFEAGTAKIQQLTRDLAAGKITQEQYNAEARQAAVEMANFGNAGVASLQEIDAEIKQTTNDMTRFKLSTKAIAGLKQAASSIGSTLGMGVSMAMMGTMDWDEILNVTAATSAMSTITAAFSGQWYTAAAQGIITLGSFAAKEIKRIIEENELEKKLQDPYYSAIDAVEKLEKEQEKLNEELDKTNKKYDEQKEHYDSFSEAVKTYTELKDKIGLTEEEQENLNSATQTLIDLHPELLKGYTSMGDAIIDMSSKWDQVIAKEEEAWQIAQEQQNKAEIDAKFNELETAKKKLEATKLLKHAAEKASGGEVTRISDLEWYEKLGYSVMGTLTGIMGMTDTSDSLFGQIYDKVGLNEIFDRYSGKDRKEKLKQFIEENEQFNDLFVQGVYSITGKLYKDANDAIDNLDDSQMADFSDKIQSWLRDPKEALREAELAAEKAQSEIDEIFDTVKDLTKNRIGILLKRNKEFKKLSEQEQNLVLETLSMDLNSKDWQEKANGNHEDYASLIVDEKATKVISEANLTSKQISLLDDFYAALQEGSLKKSQEFLEELQKSNIGKELETYLFGLQSDAQQSHNESMSEIASKMGFTLEQFNRTTVGKLMNEMGSAAAANFIRGFGNFNLSAEEEQEALEWLNNIFSGVPIDGDLLSYLTGSIDWSTMDLASLDDAEKAFKNYGKELDYTEVELENIWNRYVSFITDLDINGIVTKAFSLEGALETAETRLKEVLDQSSGITTAIQKQLENGFLSFSEMTDFKEICEKIGLDAGVYLTQGLDGSITLDVNKLYQDVNSQLLDQENLVEQVKAEKQSKLDTLKASYKLLQSTEDHNQALSESVNLAKQEADNLYKAAKWLSYIDKNVVISEAESGATQADYAGSSADRQKTLEQLKAEIDALEEEITLLDTSSSEAYQKIISTAKAAGKEWNTTIDSLYTKTRDAQEKLVKEAEDKADDLAEKLDNVAEKYKAYQEAMYGSENHKHKLDPLNNYATLLDNVTYNANKAKNALDNLTKNDNVSELLKTYTTEIHTEVNVRGAENQVIKQAMANAEAVLAPYQQYWSKINDQYYVNYQNLKGIPDDLQDEIESQIEQLRTWQKAIRDNDDAIDELRKNFIETQKKALESYVNLEKEVVDVLKEQYQEEVDNLKDKYDAMKDADDDYLDALEDAIDKERKLRDRNQDYEDLAQKEKKLSLMQRDTSGANQKEVLNLEKEVQKDRTQLLDNAVDDIVDSLKEMYELQQESREAEIEYIEAMLDEAALIRQANEVISSWHSPEEAVAWYLNNTDLTKMSPAQIELEKKNWEDLYNSKVLYQEAAKTDFEEYLKAEQAEINKFLSTISETATTESERSMSEIKIKINETIDAAKKAWEDAQTAAGSAKEAYDKASEVAAKAATQLEKLDAIIEAANTAVAKEGLSNMLSMLGIHFDDTKDNSTQPSPTLDYSRPTQSSPTLDYSRPTASASTALDPVRNYSERDLFEAIEKDFRDTIKNKNANRTSNPAIYQYYKKYGAAQLADIIREYFGVSYNDYPLTIHANDSTKEIYIDPLNGVTDQGFKRIPPNGFNRIGVYEKGGLVDYTGPAWVDGSPSRPEAFLSVDDTRLIGNLVNLLGNIPALNNSSASNNISTSTVGDTTIELTVNFDSVSEDYDADRVVKLMQEKIVEAAQYTGSNVILKKRGVL